MTATPSKPSTAPRHALPGPGDTGPRPPIRLGLLQPRPRVLRAVADPGKAAGARQRPGSLDETGRGPHLICALSDQWGYTTPSETGKVVFALSCPRPTSPAPARYPSRPGRDRSRNLCGLAEPASVNHPSPADRGRNIGRWPVTPIQRSRVDNHRVPVRSRSRRDLPRSPSSHPASALVIGRRDRQGALQACLLASRRHPGYLHCSSTSLCTAPYTPDPTGAGVIGARLSCRLSPSGGIRFWRGIGRACRSRSTSRCVPPGPRARPRAPAPAPPRPGRGRSPRTR
jgi:hypothetical protein